MCSMNSKFILTGGPGAGKTTILEALKKRGYKCVFESARKIIRDRLSLGLPRRPEPIEFAQLVLQSDIYQHSELNDGDSTIFFDRGVLDALYMLDASGGLSDSDRVNYIKTYRYNLCVFVFPPWLEIYHTDQERDQTFLQAVEVFNGIKDWYAKHGYTIIEVPKMAVQDRANFIENRASHTLIN